MQEAQASLEEAKSLKKIKSVEYFLFFIVPLEGNCMHFVH